MDLANRAAMRPVHIDNVRLEPGHGADGGFHVKLVFDVGWEDSWRGVPEMGGGRNWDAVWLFAKVKADMSFRLPHDVALLFWQAVKSEDFEPVIAVLAPHLPTAAEHLTQLSANHRYVTIHDPANPWSLQLSLVPKLVNDAVKDADDRPYLTLVANEPLDQGSGDKAFTMSDDTSHWNHVYLSPDPADHVAPEGGAIAPAGDGVGAFVYRDEGNTGRGPVRFRDVKLAWPVGREPDSDVQREVQLWIHALPMVYVAEEAFWLGDPGGQDGPTGCFYDAVADGPYRVASEAAIAIAPDRSAALDAVKAGGGAAQARLSWQDRESTPMDAIPATFPKGHGGFYCMRGHVSQGEYCDFINSLRGEAITLHYPYLAEGNFRFTLYKGGTRTRVASRPLRPCNFLSWTDTVAYLWWAGLRPMTELEFEKACRGPFGPVAQEYAWGTATMERTQVIVGDEATGAEAVDGNCHCGNAEIVLRGGDGGNGPVRCGAFASPGQPNTDWMHPTGRVRFTAASSTPQPVNAREMTGTSYYGIDCLSGNLWEFVVNVSYPEGRRFTGDHGTGQLTRSGGPGPRSDPFDERLPAPLSLSWPGSDGVGMGFRGGAFYTPARRARVADRYYAMGLKGYVMRSQDTGCRGVRTAPVRATEPTAASE